MSKMGALHRAGLSFLVLLFFTLLTAAWPAMAASPKAPAPGGEITLQKALTMALDYSPNIKQNLAEMDKSVSRRKEAMTYFLPSFGTRYSWQKTQYPPQYRIAGNTMTVGSDNVYRWSTGLTQPLFTGFRLSSQYELAKLGVDLAETNLWLVYLEVAYQVKEAYFLYLRAIKTAEVADQTVKQLEAQLKVSRDFYEVGIIPINDVLKTEVNLSDAKQSRIRAFNNRALTRSRLNRLLGLPVEHRLRVQDILKSYPVNTDFERARQVAQVERPELKAINLQLQQADQSIRMAQSGYWPSVNLKADYIFTGDSPAMGSSEYYDTTDWVVATQLDWSFWEWGRTMHQTSQQRAGKRRLEAVKRDIEDEVSLQVKEAILYLLESQANIATATVGVKQAEENYRITFERYREQLTTNTELLDAQVLLSRARRSYYDALAVFNVAEAGLQRSMGRGLAGLNLKQPPPPDRGFWP
ncbi:MAG: TolC family protein [Proteobacteria bacterium]|nr:TolC family protein [Pseudomonadota bacterium]MBU2517966.1 TolC family protein [Pseudomonadota bacterium]